MNEDVVIEARTWLGTPWHHHQKCKHYGCDCVGLLMGVADNTGVPRGEVANYYRTPVEDSLYQELKSRYSEIREEEIEPGDIVLFEINRLPRHVAIISYNGYMIHASQVNGVVEVTLDHRWRDRAYAWFRLR